MFEYILVIQSRVGAVTAATLYRNGYISEHLPKQKFITVLRSYLNSKGCFSYILHTQKKKKKKRGEVDFRTCSIKDHDLFLC